MNIKLSAVSYVINGLGAFSPIMSSPAITLASHKDVVDIAIPFKVLVLNTIEYYSPDDHTRNIRSLISGPVFMKLLI